jgi:DNA-binding PadR family transcriptional regulator
MEPLSRITPATVDVLAVLSEADTACWGLQVIKQSGRPAGSVYPILERLESIGWLSSSWEADVGRPGPRRRYYELTEGGASAASKTVADFRRKIVSSQVRPATISAVTA